MTKIVPGAMCCMAANAHLYISISPTCFAAVDLHELLLVISVVDDIATVLYRTRQGRVHVSRLSTPCNSRSDGATVVP